MVEFSVDIDHIYSCSKWCPGMTPHEAIESHIKIISYKSYYCLNTFSFETHYYTSDNPTDESKYHFFPAAIKSKILNIYIHGGYWQMLDVSSSVFMAEVFINKKCNFASIGYDLCPRVTVRDIVCRIRQALLNIIQRYPEIEEIYITGHSAGAHLALMSLIFDNFEKELLFHPSDKTKIKGLVLISGIYDIRPICYTHENKNLNLTLEEAWLLSPIRCINDLLVHNYSLKIMILVAEHDSPAFIEQSKVLDDLLRHTSSCVTVEYSLIGNKNHFSICDSIGESNFAVTDLILRFFNL